MIVSAKPKAGLPTTDRGWQTFLQNQRATGAREAPWALGQALFARLEPSGRILLYTRMRRQGDRNPRPFTLGDFPAVSVAEARKRLAETRSQIKEGRDPSVEQRRQRAGIANVNTFGALVDQYLSRRETSGDLAPKTMLLERQALERMKVAIGGRLLSDLEPHDLFVPIEKEARRLQRVGRTGRMAKIMLAATKRTFLDARDAGLLRGTSPAAELSLRRVVEEKPRDRVLFDGVLLIDRLNRELNEVGALLRRLSSPLESVGGDAPTRAALELTLALGLRAHEVCALEWSHIQLDDEVPSLVVAKSKTDAGERFLPLPDHSVSIFRKLMSEAMAPKKGTHKPQPLTRFVFEARSAGGRAEHMHPESLSRAFARACAALDMDKATLHDLRRTCISALGELGYSDAIIKRIAGHSGGADVTQRHYDRSSRVSAVHAALSAWAAVLDDAKTRAREKAQEIPAPPLALPTPRVGAEG